MLDRLMRGMNRYFEHGQHLHGSRVACRMHCRAWALLWNFAPWQNLTSRLQVPDFFNDVRSAGTGRGEHQCRPPEIEQFHRIPLLSEEEIRIVEIARPPGISELQPS